MLLCANAALEENKQRINELNVFPVPDGDTGTNMSLTMNSAAIELGRKQTDTVGAVADCAASALLRGARGNSGVILSLLFRGIAKSLKGRENANAAEFAAAVSAGVDAAYKAVMKPAEGTILTVSRLGAQAAVEFAKESTDFEAMLEALLAAAREALADTQNINPVLRRAGVVDAGGEGFVLVMDAMLGYLQGRTAAPVTAAAPAAAAAPTSPSSTPERSRSATARSLSWRVKTARAPSCCARSSTTSVTASSWSMMTRSSKCTCTRTCPARC